MYVHVCTCVCMCGHLCAQMLDVVVDGCVQRMEGGEGGSIQYCYISM